MIIESILCQTIVEKTKLITISQSHIFEVLLLSNQQSKTKRLQNPYI